ncbi:MAG: xanthine dehydrogenase family protein molybdopterin-binding subunit [Candidatus Handelsmanbacteria bacterium]|nr:xanthine dehydrogenase family protein molybdopterin-binding subunit [Candidatus Handelsmanbacteria bacterium]
MQVLSQRRPRLEAPLKVSGQAKYTYDLQLDGLLYGALLTCPYPAALVLRINESKVRRLPGVRAVLTDAHPTGTARYAGEYLAAVAAISPQIALDALELFEVEYEVRPFVVDLDAAMEEGAPRVFAERGNITDSETDGSGDVEAGFAAAEVIVEAEFRTQVQTHSSLETHGSVAVWEGDLLTIYDSTQAVNGVREGVAQTLELPADQVRVICQHMGGGFGSKLWAGRYTAIAARLAKAAGAPVKLMLSRRDEHLSTGNRPSSLQKLRLGAKRDGTLVAFSATTWGSAGIAGGAGVALPYVYTGLPAWKHTHADVYTNAGEARPFRAPGSPQGCFSMEQLMDEMAEKLGIDPLEFRLRHDANPVRQHEWRLGAERIGWSKRQPSGSGKGPLKRGLGLGASLWQVGGGGSRAEIKVFADGAVELRIGTQDIGTGTRTIVAAIAAEELGLPIGAIRPLIGDSDYPYSGGSGGSTTAPSVAPAVQNTAEKARQQVAELAAPHLGVAPEQVRFAGGRVHGTGKSLSWREVCGLLGAQVLSASGQWVEGLSSSGVAGCQFAEVEVDVDTGRVQVLRVVAVADCGLILDRLTTESQINGGVIQGLSYALFEERFMDPATGTMVNPEFENYKIAGAFETPQIEVLLFDEAERGVIGVGEPPTIPTAAAIANAVYNAIGVRLRQLPMTPDRVLQALYG